MRRYNCKGWRLLKIGRTQVELWICPPWSYIPPHYHMGFDSHIVHVWGKAEVMKEYKFKRLPTFTFFRRFKIPSFWVHGFNARNTWFVFLNFEYWMNELPFTTADKNLIEV